jgi:ATP-dependent DNA helicase RecQ
VDRELFDALRELRRALADERGVAPFVLFHDSTLRSLARVRPSAPATLARVRGVGEQKARDLGERVLALIHQHVQARGLSADQPDRLPASAPDGPKRQTVSEIRAAELFRKSASIAEVCAQLERAPSTVSGYLELYILRHKPERVDAWIDDATYAAIAAAVDQQNSRAMKPVYDALKGVYGYEQIRIVMAHRRRNE